MNTVSGDLCGQLLTEAEVEGTAHLPSMAGALVMFPQLRRVGAGPIDACWRGMAEQLLAVAPARQPAEPSGRAGGHERGSQATTAGIPSAPGLGRRRPWR